MRPHLRWRGERWLTVFATCLVGGVLWLALPKLSRLTAVELGHPTSLWLLALSPVLCSIAWHTLASVARWQRIVMATARCLLWFVITVVIAEPRLRVELHERCTVLLADVSASVPDEALVRADDWATRFERGLAAGDVRWRVVFDTTARIAPQSFRASRAAPPLSNGSDYGRALDFAAGLCGAAQNRELVLFGDGLDTQHAMASAADHLRQLGLLINVIPSRVPPPADVAVRRIQLPNTVELGRPFRAGVDLYATRQLEVELRFELDEAPNPRDAGRRLTLEPGDAHIEFETVATREGQARYAVVATTTGLDAVAENNRATASVDVSGPPKILYVEGRPERATPFEGALNAQHFRVEVARPGAFPTSLDALRDKAFVVLSDLRRDQLDGAADSLLERYVRELGGGLLFAGGSSSYAAGGWSGSALERLLPVTMTSTTQEQKADVALVLVIDRSGSMTGIPLEMAKAACGAAVETLRTNDWIEVIAFDAKPVRYVAMQRAHARAAIANDLTRILAGGDTELFPALDMAYQDLLGVDARRKHVILLTDGQSSKSGLAEIVQNMVAESVTLTIVGLGSDVDTELLRYLAGRGGGRYHAVPDPKSLPRIFTHEAESMVLEPEAPSWFEVHVKKRAGFLRGIPIERAPALHGYARTSERAGAEVILESDRFEPILARQRRGAGWTLAWTSDLRSEWARDWVRWPEYGRFFAQLLRQHQGQRVDRAIPMQIELDGDRLAMSIDAYDATGRFDNDRSIRLEIVGPDAGTATTFGFELAAPGLYRAEYRLPKLGDYRLHAVHQRFDEQGLLQPLGESFGQVSLSYPVEYQRLTPDVAALERLVQSSGGRFEPSVEVVRNGPRRGFVRYRPWHVSWLLFGALLLLVDLGAKRVRFRVPEIHR